MTKDLIQQVVGDTTTKVLSDEMHQEDTIRTKIIMNEAAKVQPWEVLELNWKVFRLWGNYLLFVDVRFDETGSQDG